MEFFATTIFNSLVKTGVLDSFALSLIIIFLVLYTTVVIIPKIESKLDKKLDVHIKDQKNNNDMVNNLTTTLVSHIQENQRELKQIDSIKEEVVKTNAILSVLSIQNNRSIK